MIDKDHPLYSSELWKSMLEMYGNTERELEIWNALLAAYDEPGSGLRQTLQDISEGRIFRARAASQRSIDSAMTWANTPQGAAYWFRIYNEQETFYRNS